METNKEESILHEPFLRRPEASSAGREPPLASAASGRGMVRSKVGKLLFPVLTAMMFVSGLQKLITVAALGNLEELEASSVLCKSWTEIKGHKRLGVDENWVLNFSTKSTLGTTSVR